MQNDASATIRVNANDEFTVRDETGRTIAFVSFFEVETWALENVRHCRLSCGTLRSVRCD